IVLLLKYTPNLFSPNLILLQPNLFSRKSRIVSSVAVSTLYFIVRGTLDRSWSSEDRNLIV
ncbi:MAG: hypothetical protein WAJ93_02650, partial [Candidatus Nitrosopolaris sp.]